MKVDTPRCCQCGSIIAAGLTASCPRCGRRTIAAFLHERKNKISPWRDSFWSRQRPIFIALSIIGLILACLFVPLATQMDPPHFPQSELPLHIYIEGTTAPCLTLWRTFLRDSSTPAIDFPKNPPCDTYKSQTDFRGGELSILISTTRQYGGRACPFHDDRYVAIINPKLADTVTLHHETTHILLGHCAVLTPWWMPGWVANQILDDHAEVKRLFDHIFSILQRSVLP
jgi:hypothetical protein